MNPLWAVLIILACFGIVGRIDYEAAIATDMIFRPAQTAEANAIKEAIAAMQARQKAAEARADRLRDYLMGALEQCGIKRVSCPHFAIAIKAKPASVVIDDATLLPFWFLTVPPTPEPQPNKIAIREALKHGPVPGAHLQQGSRLEIK
jgi:hypothetical protein